MDVRRSERRGLEVRDARSARAFLSVVFRSARRASRCLICSSRVAMVSWAVLSVGSCSWRAW